MNGNCYHHVEASTNLDDETSRGGHLSHSRKQLRHCLAHPTLPVARKNVLKTLDGITHWLIPCVNVPFLQYKTKGVCRSSGLVTEILAWTLHREGVIMKNQSFFFSWQYFSVFLVDSSIHRHPLCASHIDRHMSTPSFFLERCFVHWEN